jgi:hypothetical protein
MERLFQTPIFIPKPTGQEAAFADLGLKYPAFLMDAHIVSRNVAPAKKIADACDVFIIDPVTNHFVEKVYLTKPSFKKLSYAPAEPFKVEDLLSNESLRIEKLVIPTIEYQTSKNTGLIILPYLFSESPDDTKFGINLSMISDSLKYAREKKISKPLFAMINIGSGVLNHPRILNYIIERYDDDFDSKIQGYFIMVDQLDNKRASDESLHGLAHLVFQLLKHKKDAFVLKIGAFGEILSAIGASGFSSGIATGESFYEEGLREKATGFGRPISKWSYIPELFNYVNDEAIKRTDYKCSCSACNGSIPVDIFSKKAHFLHRRMDTMATLQKNDRIKRIDLMRARLEEAIKLASHYNKKHALALEVNHLINWRNVLESAKHWTHEDDQDKKSVDLDKLIHEARAQCKT